MADTRLTIVDALIVEQDIRFSLADLCRACGADPAQVAAWVEEGLLQPRGSGPADWVFEGELLARARAAVRLGRELELDAHATVLVLELMDEIETLRARLRREGIR